MRLFVAGFVCCLMVFVSASSSNAEELTTLFAKSTQGSPDGAVYFDLQVGPNSLTVLGYDSNLGLDNGFNDFEVWTLEGLSSQGAEFGEGWTQRTTGTGVAQGDNVPTPITLASTFELSANTLYGMALVAGNGTFHNYTAATESNRNYSNSDLALSAGSASNAPFTNANGFFPNRVWNGTIYYDIQPVPEPSTLAFLGLGLIGLFGVGRRKR